MIDAHDNPSFELTVKGQPVVFTSAFATLADAYHALEAQQPRSQFALDLLAQAQKRKLSPLQVGWLHKLATEGQAPRYGQPAAEGLNLSAIIAMMDRAVDAQKRMPRIDLAIDNQRVVLTRAGSKSRTPGAVNITDGRPFDGSRIWFGCIDRDGTVHKSGSWRSDIEELLRALAENPAGVAGQHGTATGACCFCGRALSTAESRSVGYGPVCAHRYDLPWGDTSVADQANAAAKEAAHLTTSPEDDPFRGLEPDELDRNPWPEQRSPRLWGGGVK